ncbi:uncharacterized protein LOC131520083 isoform X1 [Neofelis nebulosa]|uniref:uncharacterized protein LOC131520083 isoform X1 n=1 Tax=Neofelis nebulosa TaxID=61452 RepID=UPI00272AF23A|nr:uncharacterized protein LOC131520083 isoform X1 [Neofelis nebulosa]
MAQEIKGWWYIPNKELVLPDRLKVSILEQVVSACKTCQLTNARATSNKKGTRLRGTGPGAQWEVDFTKVKPGKYGYKYLLVFTDTFSGWVEAYPTKHETAQMVAKKLLEDILPRYGFPAMIRSDNGPAFISQVTQAVAKAVGANWKLHCAYRPQSSGQVERINRTLKETLTKLTMESGGDWVTLLPYALYRVRNTPYTLGFTPYEIMFGRPPLIIPNLRAELLAEFKDQELFLSLRGLQRAHEDIWPRLRAIYEAGPTPTPHQYRLGDWVYVKRHHQCQEALEGTLHRGADNPHRSQSRWHRDLGPSHPRSASGPLHDLEGLRHAMGRHLGPTQPAQAQATAHSTHLILIYTKTLIMGFQPGLSRMVPEKKGAEKKVRSATNEVVTREYTSMFTSTSMEWVSRSVPLRHTK